MLNFHNINTHLVTSLSKGSEKSSDPAPLRKRRTVAGIALFEALVAVVILGVGAGVALSCLASGNRVAEVNRTRTVALALCQERIDEMVASPFSPPSKLPACFGTSWPVPAAEIVTTTEAVQIHADPDGAGIVNGTRTTRVALADAALKLVRVTARVTYTYRGSNYVVETYALRSPD